MSSDPIVDTIQAALHQAGLDPRAGAAKLALDTVRRALGDARAHRPVDGTLARADADHDVIDVDARIVAEPQREAAAPDTPSPPGRFLRCVHEGPSGRRHYRLYVPAAHAATAEPLPLLVMLHGCKQTPEDFAIGTRLNALADEIGLLVAYPAQPAKANGSRCWNWFEPQHQRRDGGEPATIAGIVDDVRRSHRVDSRRVFVGGLSAGAAMAVILGQTHPELFAAVGAHSGLSYAAARDVPSAFAAMGGAAATEPPPGEAAPLHALPTFVIHGDHDATVVPGNGHAIASQAVARYAERGHALARTVEQRPAPHRRATRIVHADAEGHALVEQWIVHGGGHAWSGGHADGSFTDPHGPDASRAMVRFFMQLPRS